ncbi:MAG: methyltransferase domain-containing protein [Planctomycetaceae bacterium]|nr:methyltransferase domain-containing protein [Planctomycetaceae bacterium]
MSLDLEQLRFLATPLGRELLALDLPGDELAAQRALRKRCDAREAVAVVVLKALRRRARASGKFPPELADNLLATDTLLQQASSIRLARYVGGRLAPIAGESPIVDLCCGIGGDAIGMAQAGARVVGYDRSDVAILCAQSNAAAAGVGEHCTFHRDDVMSVEIDPAAVVHLDPDRRATGHRAVQMEDYDPPPAFLRRLVETTRAGAIKLSPMLEWQTLGFWKGASLEYVSEGGTCRQLVLWWGEAAREQLVSATVVYGKDAAPQAATLGAVEAPKRIGPLGAFLVEPDAAVIAADAVDTLAQQHGLWRIDHRVVWLFGDRPADTPLARSYRILQEAPGRREDVKKAINALGGGLVVIKPRGLHVDTDRMQKTLRGKGDRPLVVFWYRLGDQQKVLIGEELTAEIAKGAEKKR